MHHLAVVPHGFSFHCQHHVLALGQSNDLGERAVFPRDVDLFHPFALDVFNADRELSFGQGPSQVPFHHSHRLRLEGVGQIVGAQVQPLGASPTRSENRLRAICADHQAVLVPAGIQGQTHVDGRRPTSGGITLGAPDVESTPARGSVAGEIQRFAVRVEKGGFVLRVRIQGRRKLLGRRPNPVGSLSRQEQIHGQVPISVRGGFRPRACEEKGLSVRTDAGLGFPTQGAVHARSQRRQFRPNVHGLSGRVAVVEFITDLKEVDVVGVLAHRIQRGDHHGLVVHGEGRSPVGGTCIEGMLHGGAAVVGSGGRVQVGHREPFSTGRGHVALRLEVFDARVEQHGPVGREHGQVFVHALAHMRDGQGWGKVFVPVVVDQKGQIVQDAQGVFAPRGARAAFVHREVVLKAAQGLCVVFLAVMKRGPHVRRFRCALRTQLLQGAQRFKQNLPGLASAAESLELEFRKHHPGLDVVWVELQGFLDGHHSVLQTVLGFGRFGPFQPLRGFGGPRVFQGALALC